MQMVPCARRDSAPANERGRTAPRPGLHTRRGRSAVLTIQAEHGQEVTQHDQNDTDSRQQAVPSAASDAYSAAMQAALRIAEAEGAEIRDRPIWPGAASKIQYAEPLAGIRAALILEQNAGRITSGYVHYARAEGISWQQIGKALGLDNDGQLTGYALGIAAYEHVAGTPDLWHQVSFGYECQACGEWVADGGPYESHPRDNERGHAEDCTRLAADVAAWQTERDEREAGL